MIRVRQFTPGNLCRSISSEPKETDVGVMMDLEVATEYACLMNNEWRTFRGHRCWVPMTYRSDEFVTPPVPENMGNYVREVFICGGMTGFFLSPV